MIGHSACCCTETLTDLRAIKAGAPETPDNPENVDGIVQIRPGSENTSADAYPPENGPESPETPVTARTPPATTDRSDRKAL